MKSKDLTLSPTQKKVLAILKAGKGNVRRPEIQSEIFGTTLDRNNDRAVQRIIKSLRDMGFVVVSNSNQPGYRLARTQAEVDHYVAERIRAGSEMIATARKVKKTWGLRNQMRLHGVK